MQKIWKGSLTEMDSIYQTIHALYKSASLAMADQAPTTALTALWQETGHYTGVLMCGLPLSTGSQVGVERHFAATQIKVPYILIGPLIKNSLGLGSTSNSKAFENTTKKGKKAGKSGHDACVVHP